MNENGGTASACQKALAATCKALRAFSFYPENHPLREQLLHGAYQAVADLTKAGRVCLIVQRNGFAFADREAAIENTPMTTALAQELFARELQRLTFLPEISLTEYTRFLSLLSTAPQKLSDDGGVPAIMKRSGIQAIVVNEIDISAVFTKKKVGETADEAAAEGSEAREEREQDFAHSDGSLSDPLNELSVAELLALMTAEADDVKYGQLARVLLNKGRSLKVEGNFDQLYVILTGMVQHSADATKSSSRRDCAVMVLQQLGLGDMTEHLLSHLESEDFGPKDAVYRILNLLGAEVVDPVIKRLIAAGSKLSRKSLATALVRIGAPAQAALTPLLRDGRWQVVHTAVAILGEMGSRESVKGLTMTVCHSDNRVRLETIRSLARIGGMEATTVLLGLLKDENQTIAQHAITCLGNNRNQAALQPLLQLVLKSDLRGKSHPLKKEALVAIARIGDRLALDPLFKLVKKRYWLGPSRGEELKVLSIEAIATLGVEPARAFLHSVPQRNSRLSRACNTALEAMAQRNLDHE